MGSNPLAFQHLQTSLAPAALPGTTAAPKLATAGGRPGAQGSSAQSSAKEPEVGQILMGVIQLAFASTDSISKCVQHYQGNDAWQIGTLPSCELMADTLEAQARSLLTNSQLNMRQIDEISAQLKSVVDLRTVARCARQTTQLSWLLRDDQTSGQAVDLIRRVGEPSAELALAVSSALQTLDRHSLRQAALLYRKVDAARTESEDFLRRDIAFTALSPSARLMARAGVWFMAVAGEGMARVAARVAG